MPQIAFIEVSFNMSLIGRNGDHIDSVTYRYTALVCITISYIKTRIFKYIVNVLNTIININE